MPALNEVIASCDIGRLSAVAVYRMQPARSLKPNASLLCCRREEASELEAAIASG